MSDARVLVRLAVAHEVMMTACCLFVLDTRYGEMQMNYRVADHAHPGRLGDVTGKYVKRASGYIHIHENRNAEYLTELPEGISSDDVVVDDLDTASATPLQDRLRTIAGSLRPDGNQDADADSLADAIDAVLAAAGPDSGARWMEHIRERARSEVFEADGPGDDKDMTERAYRLLDELGQLAEELQAGLRGDGKTVGGILAIRELMLARAAMAQDAYDEATGLIESLLYVTAPGVERVEDVAMGLSGRMVRHGQSDVVREVAERVKAEGDVRTDQALDGDFVKFYATLYPAAAYELAVVHMGRAAAEATEDPDERTRWSKLAVNAEERAVRVSTSLGFAVMNLDGSLTSWHLAWLRQVREEEGVDAARLKAQDLIGNQLFYPKAALPVLLGEEPLSVVQVQRT